MEHIYTDLDIWGSVCHYSERQILGLLVTLCILLDVLLIKDLCWNRPTEFPEHVTTHTETRYEVVIIFFIE
jgi:hypothetical protein